MLPLSLVEKAIAAAAIVGILIAGLWLVRRDGYKDGERAAEQRMQALVNIANAKAAEKEKASESTVNALEKTHATQLADLDTRYRDALKRIGPVRVQNCSASGGGLRPPAQPAGDSDGNALERGHAPEAGVDIGPALALYGKDAEALRLAVETCKAYGQEIEREFRRP